MKATLTIEGTPEYVAAVMQGPEHVKKLLAEVERLKAERSELETDILDFFEILKDSSTSIYYVSHCNDWVCMNVRDSHPIKVMRKVAAAKREESECAKDK